MRRPDVDLRQGRAQPRAAGHAIHHAGDAGGAGRGRGRRRHAMSRGRLTRAARAALRHAALGVLLAGAFGRGGRGRRTSGRRARAPRPRSQRPLRARCPGPRPGGDQRPHRRPRRRADDGTLTLWIGTASGGRMEVDRRRRHLRAGLRRPRAVDRRRRHRPLRPRHGLGRHRRDAGCATRVSVGAGVFRTTDGGDDLEPCGLARHRAHRPHPRPPGGRRHRLGVRHRAPVGRQRAARRLQDHRRRRDAGRRCSTSTPTPAAPTSTIDPQDPDVLYAAMWQFRRRPDFFTSGGPGSGLYRTPRRRRPPGPS